MQKFLIRKMYYLNFLLGFKILGMMGEDIFVHIYFIIYEQYHKIHKDKF
jgi:hypothetical protein